METIQETDRMTQKTDPDITCVKVNHSQDAYDSIFTSPACVQQNTADENKPSLGRRVV